MPDQSGGSVHGRNQLQLTVLSGEILKRQLETDHEISLSCNISELPNYHCNVVFKSKQQDICLLYTSPSPRDVEESRMPSSA